MADGTQGNYVTAPGYSSLRHLSDDDLNYLIKEHEGTGAATQTLSDEELQSLLMQYEAPEGNAPIEAVPQVKEQPPELSAGEEVAGAARELAGGAAFELADEAEAAARAPFSNKSYEEILKDIRMQRAGYGQAHPALAPALNLAGGIGSMFIPGAGAVGRGAMALTRADRLASPLARTVAGGAMAGGAAGFGSGEGLEGSIQNAAIGAALGAPLGAAAHGVGNVARWGRGVLTARGAEMTEEEAALHAAEILQRRLREGNLTPEQAAQMLEMEQRYGIPSVLGTVTPELARLTENVVQTPSGERADLARRLFEQQAGAPSRVAGHIRQAVPTPDYFASEDAITKSLQRNAARAYERAYAAGDVSDGLISDFLKAPDVQIAYKDALANAERLKEAAKLSGGDPSAYNLRDLFVVDAQGNIVKQSVPDIRTLDYIKQAMDRRINGLYASGQGGEATALKQMRNAFVDRLDQVGPAEYKAARQQYKGDIEIRDALEQGRQSNTLRWQDFNRLMKDYSPGEQQAFKTGFVQNIMQRFENTGNSKNFAKDLLKGNDRRKFQAIMDPGEFDVFEAALRRESELFDTIGRTTQGSATFGRAAEKADIEQQIAGGNVEGALDVLLNPTPGNIARRTLQALAGMRNANVSRATYTQLARMLKAGTPQEVDDVLRQLEAAAPGQEAADRALQGRVAKATTAAASTIAPPPEDTSGQLPSTNEVVVPSLDEQPGVPAVALTEPEVPAATEPQANISVEFPALVEAFGEGYTLLPDFTVITAAGQKVASDVVKQVMGIK